MVKLSTALIVKNEETCLDKCLSSLKGIDEIIVCDTGSEDSTIEIAKKYTDKVFTDYKWNDDFAEARNHALKKATGDWILVIDADERLEENGIERAKKMIEKAEQDGFRTLNCEVWNESQTSKHYQPRLFKRAPDIFWKGAIHNYVSIVETNKCDLKIFYTYSKAHEKDPDRALRILTKEVERGGKVREKFYLAREYWYRKDFPTTIKWLDEYFKVATWGPEIAEAHMLKARAYLGMDNAPEARKCCLDAININADFKEALGLMSRLTGPNNSKKWKQYEELATNENVLFTRQ
jgi:glycosyltransferase involved in cell wall biosynthesis